MDAKRKASGAYGPGIAGAAEDRAAKKRRLQKEFNLEQQGETPESSTQYGMHFLDQIRNTKDKSGRLVAGHFETLPPVSGNEEYYRRIRMPISLDTIEHKLHNREFANLTELESYVKRMVCNAKDWYNRNTLPYDDAERVRKALSNYMTVLNPAYKNTPGYTATPTPFPLGPEDNMLLMATPSANYGANNTDAKGEGDDMHASNAPTPLSVARRRPAHDPRIGNDSVPSTPLDAMGETGYMSSSNNNHGGNVPPSSSTPFQQAQERIIGEAIRRKDEEDSFPHFAEFINLPARALKDYYAFIDKPMSLKKFQKMALGFRGKHQSPTGVSEFTTWKAFEETASLLWDNAFSFNEDDSEIYALAEELRDFFMEELKEAKATIPEPAAPPKIKLKVPASSDGPMPISTTRKITLQVPGRGGSTDSPGPLTAHSVDSSIVSGVINGSARGQFPPIIADKRQQSVSASVASPSSSVHGAVKREDLARNSPAIRPNQPSPHPLTNGATFQPPKHPTVEQNMRLPGKTAHDAVLSSLKIRSPVHRIAQPTAVKFEILPDPFNLHQSLTLNVPASETQIQIVPTIAKFVQSQQRQYKLFVIFNNAILRAVNVEAPGTHVYDAQLTIGRVNTIEVHLVVAIPKDQRQPGGPEAEVERVTVMVNTMRP